MNLSEDSTLEVLIDFVEKARRLKLCDIGGQEDVVRWSGRQVDITLQPDKQKHGGEEGKITFE